MQVFLGVELGWIKDIEKRSQMGKRSEVSIPQRREAVLSLLRREEPAAKIARRFGVSEPTLYRWRDEFLAGGEAALSKQHGNGEQRQIAELRQQLEKRGTWRLPIHGTATNTSR